jgi:hypothetical protein
MENNELQQISFISIFKKVINEERKVALMHTDKLPQCVCCTNQHHLKASGKMANK